MALGDVFLTLVLHELTETLHNATLAGYEYSVEDSPEGIIFFLGGYSEKIKVVARDSIHAMQTLQIDEESFTAVVSHLKQVYMDSLLNPFECARAVRYSLMEAKDPSILERFEQLDYLAFPKLLDYIAEFYRTLFVEAMVTGNLSLKDATDIGEMLKKLVKKPLAEKDFPKPCVLELPPGEYKCLVPAINKEDTNSCVVHYFQQGPGTFLSTCLNDTLVALMTEPLFNILRTKHQLGYSVFCQTSDLHGISGFMIVVESQANKFSMNHIDELMNSFLVDFEKMLEKLPAEKLNSVIENQRSLLTYEDGDLYGEASRYWQEIVTGAYVFNRPEQQTINELGLKVNELEQYGRRANVKVFGLRDKKDETSAATVNAVIEIIRTKLNWREFNPSQIDVAHRIDPYRNNADRSVIVRFSFIRPRLK
ncbi:insulin-degrading enzyme [Plakobranchus ocellatus]|uniref:Insulin-degrading enzyme n=1 Tax=Plakobranchus ocellatus TaxID=259542 RepID=A0AAV4D7F4_9GAST|nr:insulin-degrading enzyme [Plakobranchus ocellatus]